MKQLGREQEVWYKVRLNTDTHLQCYLAYSLMRVCFCVVGKVKI